MQTDWHVIVDNQNKRELRYHRLLENEQSEGKKYYLKHLTHSDIGKKNNIIFYLLQKDFYFSQQFLIHFNASSCASCFTQQNLTVWEQPDKYKTMLSTTITYPYSA